MNEYQGQYRSSGKQLLGQFGENNFKGRYEKIGFNVKKRQKKLIKLVPLGIAHNIEAINRIEQDLLKDIRDIDEMLQKRQSNMTYAHGILFSYGLSKQLLKQFYSALQINPDAVEDGFYLWKLKELNENYELVSNKLVNSPRHFPQKLLDKSIQNLQRYQLGKHEESLIKGKRRWNTSINAVNKLDPENKIKRLMTEAEPKKIDLLSLRRQSNARLDSHPKNYYARRKMTDFKQIAQHARSNSHPLHMHSYVETHRNRQALSQREQQNQPPSLEQLTIMLKKQHQVVGIWLPPSSCPQLIGVISVQIKQKSFNTRYCLIKKYYWYRHSLTRRLFDSILQWSSTQYDSIVQLSMYTTRNSFNAFFSSLGWHLSGWITDDKLKITYSKT